MVRYGGNTSCVQVRSDGGTLVVLDLGSGAQDLGEDLLATGATARDTVYHAHALGPHPGLPVFRAAVHSRKPLEHLRTARSRRIAA